MAYPKSGSHIKIAHFGKVDDHIVIVADYLVSFTHSDLINSSRRRV